jgi:maleylacetoacetate isomerase/maleylpyruvate isomerase
MTETQTNGQRILFGYWRSSAAYRVRIALNYKRLEYQDQPVSLIKGEQHGDEYRQLNPQGLVPALRDQGTLITQSLAICEYLDEAYPDTPRLLPKAPLARARVRALAQLVACDIHPLNNLRVLKYLQQELKQDDAAKQAWIARWTHEGLDALETMAEPWAGDYLYGDEVTLADVFLAPQIYNARRFNLDLSRYPVLLRIDETLAELPSFQKSHPSQQLDAT